MTVVALQKGLDWWLTGLRSAIPSAVKAYWHRARAPRMWLSFNADGYIVHRTGSGAISSVAHRDLVKTSDFFRGMVAESVISVHLAPELAFITTLELPTAAEINLKKVLQHHIGLCVPLEPDDVVFDFAITARDTFRQTVFVDVAIVRRATIASALAATRELNCKASSVKVQSETHEWLNFEFHVGDTPNIVTERSKKTSLTACALLLAGCCVTSWLWQSHIYLGTLDDSLASLHKQAAPAFELRARLSSLRDQVDYINRSVRGPGRLVVLNELTRCMPDSVWVSDLQITGTHVTMSGNGLAVAGIIRLLGLSEILASPRFTAPIYSWQDGTERFEIAADIKALP